MTIAINDEFLALCRQVVEEGLSEAEWSQVESDDMFQSESFAGGYDADEKAFCFSYYDRDQREYWFQLSMAEIRQILDGIKTTLDVGLTTQSNS